jgi:hypothetical protein
MDAPIYFRVRWRKVGGHYHCRVFSRPASSFTWALLGVLVMDEQDWHGFQNAVRSTFWDLLPEEG